MTRLTLLRHAEAERAPGQDPSDRFSLADSPLSAAGRAQAAAVRDRLAAERFDAVLASPLRRAVETARIVAGPHGQEVRVVADLREYPFARPGDRYPEVLAAILALPKALARGEDPVLPGGERFGAARERFASALDAVLANHRAPLVVAHGIANRVWLCGVMGRPLADLLALPQDHAAVNKVVREAGRAAVTVVNGQPLR